MVNREWNPAELLELSGYYWKTCVLHAGVKLDVFTIIGDEPLTAEQVSRKLNGAQRGVQRLLNALVAMALLSKTDEKYANTPSSLDFLSKTSTKYIGHIIMHHHHLMESWSNLDQAVQSGQPIRTRSSFSGTYAIHFCLNNPQLNATVFDLPTTKPFAEKTIVKFGLTDRIRFREGNYLEDEVKGNYDAAWLSHILHGEGPEACQKIIQKATAVLEPGGVIIVHDFILNNTMDGPLFPALFSLNMLLGTSTGQSYSEKQIFDMLTGAGVKDIRRIPVQMPNDSGIIAGIA
jgi:hypothetical protein